MSSTVEDIVSELVTGLDDPALTFANVLAQARNLHSNVSPPRVTVVPIGGPILTPDNPGHGKLADGTRARILLHRRSKYEVYCEGRTDDETETLLHNVLRVLRNKYLTGAIFGTEEWLTGDANTDGYVLEGTAVKFDMTLVIPVYDIHRTLKLLTATPKFQGTDLWGDNEEDVSCNPIPEDP